MLSSNSYHTSRFCVFADPRETKRVDTYLSALFPEKSRSYLQRMIEEEKIFVNGKTFSKNKKIYRGDEIEIHWKIESMELIAEEITIDIVYENADFAVINKDPHLNTHPTPGEEGRRGTLVNALLHHFSTLGVRSDEAIDGGQLTINKKVSQEVKEDKVYTENRKDSHSTANCQLPTANGKSIINGVERPGIVHRLDKDTSGLIIIAKNDRAMHALQLKMANRTVHKQYLALVVGIIPEASGYIESFIGRDPFDRKRMTTYDPINPKIAKTRFRKRQEIAGKYTLVEVDLLTGRTHQIRVHLASIGYPILGDRIYGRERENQLALEKYGLDRQWLHAYHLDFTLFGVDYSFDGELKEDLKRVLA